MNRPVAVVTGVGPGTGSAIVRRLAAGGYTVAMLARNRERLASLERDVQHTKAYACDVSDEAAIEATIANLKRDMGAPSVLVHNAVGGAWGSFQDIDPKVLNRNFQVNTMALLHLARRLAPTMVERSAGAIVVTGNTSALRGEDLSADLHDRAAESFAVYLGGIDQALHPDRRYLVGDALSLADICFVAELCLFSNERPRGAALCKRGLAPVLADGWREAYPRAAAHLERLSDHPAFAPDVRPYLAKLEAIAT